MTIHHYTKVEALLLILRHRTIRFNRADRLDDVEEVPYRPAGLDPRRYFVSSWSTAVRGEAGLWYRYADHDRGVRLSLGAMPFDWTRLNVEFVREVADREVAGKSRKYGIRVLDQEIPFGETTFFGNGYIVSPMSGDLRSTFGGSVTYAKDPAAEAAKTVTQFDSSLTFDGDGTRVARIKGRAWEDQDEYRFVLSAITGPKLDYASDSARYQEALKDLMEWGAERQYRDFHSEATHIDVALGKEAFDGMTVTLGPRVSKEDRTKVICAVEELAPLAKVVESELKVRF